MALNGKEDKEKRARKTPMDATGPLPAGAEDMWGPAPGEGQGAMPTLGGNAWQSAPQAAAGPAQPPAAQAGTPLALAESPPAATNQTAAPAPTAGFNAAPNPGAMLPGSDGGLAAPAGPLTAALTSQMMERPDAASKLAEFNKFQSVNPMQARGLNMRIMPGDFNTPGYNPALGGVAMQESPGDLHDRSMRAFEGLDKMAGASEEMALKKYLGVGGLGVQAGHLGVAEGTLEAQQRKQIADEFKLEHDMAQDKTKTFDIGVNQNKTPAQLTAIANLKAKLYGNGAVQGFTPGLAFNKGGRRLQPVGVQGPAQPVGVSGGPAAGASGPKAPGAGPRAPTTAPTETDFSTIPPDAKDAIDKLGEKPGIDQVASILARHMDQPGGENLGSDMMRYLNTKFGEQAVRKWMQPSPMANFWQRGLNIFGAPNEAEAVASKFRNLNGLPARGPRPAANLGDSILGGWLGLGR